MSLHPAFVAGFVVAEGCFVGRAGGRRFALTVALAAIDAATCQRLAGFFGVGRVYRYARRQPHHDDVAIFSVQSLPELRDVVVPFCDEHLPPSAKRDRYLEWRAALRAYSLAAAGSSVTRVSQSTGEASDQRRSRS